MKYRAWDTEKQSMHENINPIYNPDGKLEAIIFSYGLGGYDLLELELHTLDTAGCYPDGDMPYIVMSYTGLFIQNHVEMCINDVTKIPHSLDDGYDLAVVRWDDEKAKIYFDVIFTTDQQPCSCENCTKYGVESITDLSTIQRIGHIFDDNITQIREDDNK